MYKKILIVLISISFLITPLPALSSQVTLSSYLRPFYSKHSRWLDVTYEPLLKTWHIDIPYYEPEKQWQETINRPRWHMSSASFYKYRLEYSPYARGIVRQAILDSTLNSKRAIFDQSFDGAIADFLVVRLIEGRDEVLPRLYSAQEKRSILAWLKPRLFYGLKAPDTENRAALAGVYWYYVGQYLHKNNFLTNEEWRQVKKLTKQKINLSIEQTLISNQAGAFIFAQPSLRVSKANPDRAERGSLRQAKIKAPASLLYRESGKFSLHYHIVEAYMLLSYGVMAGGQEYIGIARKMTRLVNKLAREDGFLDASLGYRPSGIGAQGYLMAGVLNLYFGDNAQAQKFLNYADNNRFFADPKYPNRLVWFDTSPNIQYPISPPALLRKAKRAGNIQFNDDISFVNMAELAQILMPAGFR
jgi:hypothetical protein